MKLLNKLTLYISLSKTVIVILFIWLLPKLIKDIAFQYTNRSLQEQKKKVIDNINKKGIDYYFQGDSSYGSYTMLKQEYISLDIAAKDASADTVETSKRIIEGDTLNYRILVSVFAYKNRNYVLEIGKTLDAIDQYNRPLQRVAFYVLAGLIGVTLLIDLLFTRLLLRPLGVIIRTKLRNRKFPFKEEHAPVKTSTADFKYLDASLSDLMQTINDAFEKEKEFTSNASHELMTPISILQNKLENLMDGNITDELHEKLSGMMTTLGRLKKIVRSLLLISRIENDQYARTDSININKVLQDVIKELEDRLEAKNIQLHIDLQTDADLRNTNYDLFFQLLYNVINNAIKYNKENGKIVINGYSEKGTSYKLSVEDTGTGISENEIPYIFDRFKKSAVNTQEGYGIGLSIVKSIAQYHGWKIDIISQLNSGTIFSISFPEKMPELAKALAN